MCMYSVCVCYCVNTLKNIYHRHAQTVNHAIALNLYDLISQNMKNRPCFIFGIYYSTKECDICLKEFIIFHIFQKVILSVGISFMMKFILILLSVQ